MAHKIDDKFVCPYFIQVVDRGIKCEGFCRGSVILQKFQNFSERSRWIATFCSNYNYGEVCPFARVLEAEYEED